ncbi:MAG: flippase [Peptococcaceae bacterium]|nr:flippase [Peptococcaceae bacterium]
MELRLVLKNAAALSVASVLAKTISAIVAIIVTRYLGPGPFGEYSIALAFVGTFILFTDFGLSQLMVQDGSRDEQVLPVYVGNILLFKLLTCAAMYLAMILFMGAYSRTVQIMVLILGAANGLNALHATVYNYFQAKQQMYKAAGYQFLTTFLIGALTLIVVVAHGDVVAITVTHLAAYVLLTLLLYLALRREISWRLNLKRLPQMFRRGFAFGISYIFYNFYFQIAIVILPLLHVANDVVGTYAAPYRLISILLFIPGILTSVLYPVLYQLGVTSREKHQETIEKIFKVLSAVGIPGSALLFVLAEPLLVWLFKGRFPDSVPIMMILSWFFALECLSYALGDVLTTTDRQWTRTWIQGIGAAGNIALNLFLIPRYGIYGASWAAIATEIYIFVAYYWQVRTRVYDIRIWRQLPKIVIAALVMAAVAWFLRFLQPMAAAAIAGIVYLGLLIALDKDFRRLGAYTWRQARAWIPGRR